MDGWMDGWMGGFIEWRMDKWMNGLHILIRMNICLSFVQCLDIDLHEY